MIQLHGLTARQHEICDQLWQLQTLEQVYEYRDSLDLNEQPVCDLLIELITIEAIDQQQTEYMAYEDAAELLARFS